MIDLLVLAYPFPFPDTFTHTQTHTHTHTGMNVPDRAIPLCKSIKIDFVRRCEGDIKAEAYLTEEQLNKIHTEEKGDVSVCVCVTDSSGKEPIKAEMVWAWVPKVRKEKK